jgi:hypothetical protein
MSCAIVINVQPVTFLGRPLPLLAGTEVVFLGVAEGWGNIAGAIRRSRSSTKSLVLCAAGIIFDERRYAMLAVEIVGIRSLNVDRSIQREDCCALVDVLSPHR